ncbi:alpha-mannosidase [Mycobacterium sp. E2699]|uniref:glycoside hydrolase family 38 N-terminal domain-containing protein n=1 Tax=Mycobacterium sp. E2699 TaxID=1834137 RepID=UPI0007FC5B7F|nr:NEW3 domain-containing protein [Mycobacterium sp. E2699]OBH04898.1 alpha-mannosidase [Mycobacterium sp. E2699]
MQVISAGSTELFVGPPDAPLQLARVDVAGCAEPTPIRIDGDGLSGEAVAPAGAGVVEVPVTVDGAAVGQRRAARVRAGSVTAPFEFTVAEPGWTMFMVSHFHYDPVWWNTQGAYTSEWAEDPPGRQTNGFELVHAHLEMARREPEYKFVLAEVDYLKPYWDTHPEDRADLRRFLAEGRVEVMGGTYNEPNTNLTGPETTIRNLVHGSGFQRRVLGADPATAWQLDVFGHDPQFPGMAADAGLTSSSWARGPHHQWGPGGGIERMQFCSEFEWIAPSGRGLLTHYMPAHYGAGWGMDESASLAEAEAATFALFDRLKKVALTRNVLLPVGTDYTPPNKWVTAIHRDWAARYTWPRFVCALPREFFAAVRAELAQRGREPSPQTRDMNPIYTGKDVSYIDTKQANRAAENAVLAGERFAVFAALMTGAEYPQPAFAKAWVQLAYGAHHDAITGSESDQVYLDLLTGWRDAWELGRAARDNSLARLSALVVGQVLGDLVVWNPLAHRRSDVVTARLDPSPTAGVRVLDPDGVEVPAHVEHDGRSVTWLARDVPSLGWRAYRLAPADHANGWESMAGTAIGNEHYRLEVDPRRGGGVVSLVREGRQLIAAGRVGNELALYEEYPAHPQQGEGPWHLLPKGPVVCSSEAPARVRAYRGPLGQRLVVRGRVGGLLRYTQTLTLWHGVDRLDCRTAIDEFTGADTLLRLRWPCPVPGAMPVSEVGDAVVGRGFALLHDGDRSVDTAQHPWTLDNPAYGWFGLSSAVRVRVGDDVRAVSVAEVVTPAESVSGPLARELMVALVRAGVTATCSGADRPRYGCLDVDSNLPDVRIALGGPARNSFAKAVLAQADPQYTAELDRQLAATGRARVWVPAEAPLAAAWVPGADLRSPRALPVLVVDGDPGLPDDGLAAAIASVVDDLGDFEIVVAQDPRRAPPGMQRFESHTVALLNRGVPSFAVDTDGTLHTALMRSCTGWPSGTWIDDPRRTAPDGSNFQLQHWTHAFEYALVSGDGDWRQAEIPSRAAQFADPLLAVVPGGARGGLAPCGSLLHVEPANTVQLGALKAAGNPLTTGSARPVDPGAVALRLVETTGNGVRVDLGSGPGTVRGLQFADLLENPGRDTTSIDLHGYQIATVLARLEIPSFSTASERSARLAPDAEAAQPLYARYWLHNRGPAPLGGLPAVAHLHPRRVTAVPGGQVALRLTAASDCSDAALAGAVTLVCPDGWSAAPAELPFRLRAGEHREADLVLSVPPRARPGLYPVRAQLGLTGDDVSAAWRQVVEDVCVVEVGDCAEAELLHLVDGPADVELAAGGTARLAVTVGSHARADLALEGHLISPWGTWEWIGPAALGAVLPAGGAVELGFDVAPPPWLDPGRWWALVRVGCAGRLLYSPAVRVTVT